MIHSAADRRRARREQDIVEAALDLVVEEGLGGLTMKALADRVDLTAGALYRYFPGKDAIILGLVAHVLADLDAAMGAVQRRAEGLPGLVLPVALVGVYRAWASERPRHARLLAALVSSPELQVSSEAARPAVPGALALVGRVAGSLDAAAASGCLAPGDALGRAVVLWATVDGVLGRRKLLAHAPGLVDVDALAEQAVLALLRGWGASADLVAAASRLAEALLAPPEEP